jgi:peptide/nickel transport system substrate-binding protein
MLRDAGYLPASDKAGVRKKGDVTLSLELLYPEGPLYQALADQIAKDWTALGVQVTVNSVAYDDLIHNRLDSRSYQAALVNLNLTKSYDPDPYPFWDQAQMTGGQNYTQWDNRVASEYLEQARMSTDFAERVRLYRNFQVIFSQDMPALPLFYPVESYAVDRQVQGISVGPLYDSSDRFATVTEWFLPTKKAAVPTKAVTPTVTK